jgi:hypothetical protein
VTAAIFKKVVTKHSQLKGGTVTYEQ